MEGWVRQWGGVTFTVVRVIYGKMLNYGRMHIYGRMKNCKVKKKG
jgi:hypothetical protein